MVARSLIYSAIAIDFRYLLHLLFLHITIISVANVVLGPFTINSFTRTHSDLVGRTGPTGPRTVLINGKSNYGFTKLQDLFEAIPDVVQIEDDQPEKRLALTIKERMAILAGKYSK